MELAREVITPGPGQCILHNLGDRLFVERADPVVAIAEALPRQILEGTAHRDMRLEKGVLVIAAANQEVRYRLAPSGQPGYLRGHLC